MQFDQTAMILYTANKSTIWNKAALQSYHEVTYLNLPLFRQGWLSHSLILISHVTPSNPGKQRHSYRLIPSTQRAPFWHGLLSHSMISVSHLGPVNPGGHWHRKRAISSTQTPPWNKLKNTSFNINQDSTQTCRKGYLQKLSLFFFSFSFLFFFFL